MTARRHYPTPARFCISYCQHGGVCERERGHDGKHDSGYCEWTDAEAVTKAEGDALARAASPFGELFVAVDDVVRAIDPPEDE